MHSTNYENTFIEVAEDCPAETGIKPPRKGDKKTVANLQFEMLVDHPYEYTSDDVLFTVYADRKEIPRSDLRSAREDFFSKGQSCFRASPLTKRYGWGIHANENGKIAMYGMETREYKKMLSDKAVQKVKAMRSSRKK